MCVSFVAVSVQNNLAYVATSHLDGPTYQIICQSKILITALLCVAILGRSLASRQWVSLGALTLGVGMVQLSGSETGHEASDKMVEALLPRTQVLECHPYGVEADTYQYVHTSAHHTLQIYPCGIGF